MQTSTLFLLSLVTTPLLGFGCSSNQLDTIETASDARARVCAGIASLDSSDPAVLRAQQACAVGAGVAEVGAAVGGCRETDPAESSQATPALLEQSAPVDPQLPEPSPAPAATPAAPSGT
jgi:hypothetical protein